MCGGIVCSHKIHNSLTKQSFILVSTVGCGLNPSGRTCLDTKVNIRKRLRVQNLWPLRSYWVHLSPPTSQQLGDMEGLAARDLGCTRSVVHSWRLLDPCGPAGKTELPTSCWTLAKQTCDTDWLAATWVVLRKVSFDRSHKFTSSQEMEQAPWRLHSLSTRCRNGQLLQWPDPTWRAFWSGPKLTLLLPIQAPSLCLLSNILMRGNQLQRWRISCGRGPHAGATEPRLASYVH